MRFRLFAYPAGNDDDLAELNGFLEQHRVLDVSHHMADDGRRIVFVVEYLERKGTDREPGKQPRVDYREQLTEAQFAVFAQLRDLRKAVADQEGVAVYNVFTNAQLAAMVEKTVRNTSELAAILGVGQARVDKYGERFLALLRDLEGTGT